MRVNILSMGNKDPGEHISDSLQVPLDASDRYRVEIDIRRQDLVDPAFFCELKFEWSEDNNDPWRPWGGMTVIGGDFPAWEKSHPWIQVNTNKVFKVRDLPDPKDFRLVPFKGSYVRLLLSVNQRTRIGLDIQDDDLSVPEEDAP